MYLELNEKLKNIKVYVNNNSKRINNSKSLSDNVREAGFPHNISINVNFKEFLENNENLTVTKPIASLFI